MDAPILTMLFVFILLIISVINMARMSKLAQSIELIILKQEHIQLSIRNLDYKQEFFAQQMPLAEHVTSQSICRHGTLEDKFGLVPVNVPFAQSRYGQGVPEPKAKRGRPRKTPKDYSSTDSGTG